MDVCVHVLMNVKCHVLLTECLKTVIQCKLMKAVSEVHTLAVGQSTNASASTKSACKENKEQKCMW